MGVRAILFDADGVIQGPSPGLPARISESFGIPLGQIDDFLHEVVSPAERRALTGEKNFFKELVEEFARRGCDAPVPKSLVAFTAIEVYTDVTDLIGQLRASGTRCYLASNQVPFRARYMSDVLGYRRLFDHEYYSCDLGCAKPDTAFFRTILSQTGSSPSETLFIDDHEENVAAARDVGLHASLFAAQSHPDRRRVLLHVFGDYGLVRT